MALFGFGKKKQKAPDYKDIARLDGKPLQYAIERVDGQEKVLGKSGGIIILNDAIVIQCEAKEVFRCKLEGGEIAELLSGNGCEIKGYDAYTGQKRHVVAHYSYYRK